MKVKAILLLLSLVLTLPATAQYAGKLGINLGGGMGDFFVDVAKTARPWEFPGGGTMSNSYLDANGWPVQDFRTVLMDHRPVPEWGGTIDDPEVFRVNYSGTYQASFQGQATLTPAGDASVQNQQYDAGTNTTSFDLVVGSPGANHALVILTFIDTRRDAGSAVNTGISDLRIIRPGYANRPTQTFTDAFIQTLTNVEFSTIRSQNFTGTTSWNITYPAEVNWADRKLPDYSIQGSSIINKREAAAWEYYIQLCNKVQMDIWINVPISASDTYVTQLAQLLKDSLDANLNIYVENDNEVWNSAPAFVGTYDYNQAEASALSITPEQNIARRAIELSNLFSGVFGTTEINNRVRVVLASHSPMVKWWVKPMMEYIQANYGAPKDYIYAISRQTYFRSSTDPNATVAQLLQGARDDIDDQLDFDATNEANRSDWVSFASQWQLPGGVNSYEGGPHFPSGGGLDNLDNQILTHRDPGMKDVLKYNLADAWWDLGGELAMHFTLYGGYNRYGCWGLTDDLNNPNRNSKMAALRELVNGPVSLEPGAALSGIILRPNPTKGILILDGELPERATILVMDLTGRTVFSRKDIRGQSPVSLPDVLPNGIYTVKVTAEIGQFTQKILLNR